MSFEDLDRIVSDKDLRRARLLLREYDEIMTAQSQYSISLDPSSLREIGRQLTGILRGTMTAINGDDDRIDVVRLPQPQEASSPITIGRSVELMSAAENSRAVALLTDESLLKPQGNGRLRLETAVFGEVKELCRSERFFDRPIATPATAFLVRSDIVVTLRHILPFFSSTENIRAIFNFELQDVDDPTSFKVDFEEEEVYAVTENYSLVDDNRNAFVALRLSRPVVGRSPVLCNFGKPINSGERVYMIGHPCGLPKVYEGDAKVLDASGKGFTANLDAFSGASANPVFNADTGQVEGVLAEGGEDFQSIPNEEGGSCNISIVYEDRMPFGYKIVRIGELQKLFGA